MKRFNKALIVGAVSLFAVLLPIAAYAAETDGKREFARSEIVYGVDRELPTENSHDEGSFLAREWSPRSRAGRFYRGLLPPRRDQNVDFEFENFLTERVLGAGRPGIGLKPRICPRTALNSPIYPRNILNEIIRNNLQGGQLLSPDRDALCEVCQACEECGEREVRRRIKRFSQNLENEQFRAWLEEAADAIKNDEAREFFATITPENLNDFREMFTY